MMNNIFVRFAKTDRKRKFNQGFQSLVLIILLLLSSCSKDTTTNCYTCTLDTGIVTNVCDVTPKDLYKLVGDAPCVRYK